MLQYRCVLRLEGYIDEGPEKGSARSRLQGSVLLNVRELQMRRHNQCKRQRQMDDS